MLDTIVRTAVGLCNSYDAVILLRQGEHLRIAAHYGPMKIDFEQLPIGRDIVSGRTVIDGSPVHVHDLTAEGDEFPRAREIALRLNQRTVLRLPLSREGQTIGCLFLRRTEVLPFTDQQIALLQTFADQAAIAIENVRLFKAEQQRTRELSESLEQQTATSEVLQVISRSAFDLKRCLIRWSSRRHVCARPIRVNPPTNRESASYYSAASYRHTPEYEEHLKPLTLTGARRCSRPRPTGGQIRSNSGCSC